MAIARCEKCGKPTQNVKPPAYSNTAYLPPHYPDSGLVCGSADCDRPALIWLKLDEEAQYRNGQRVFDLPTKAAKVRISN
jgi:hypothetical protein